MRRARRLGCASRPRSSAPSRARRSRPPSVCSSNIEGTLMARSRQAGDTDRQRSPTSVQALRQCRNSELPRGGQPPCARPPGGCSLSPRSPRPPPCWPANETPPLGPASGRRLAAEKIGNQLGFRDPSGTVSTYSTNGALDTGNPFFQSMGTNGRSCASCHLTSDAFGLSATSAQVRFAASGGTDRLFAAVDGANCPSAAPSDAAARSLLLNNGLIRVFLLVPASAQFTVEAVHDPYGCALVADPQGAQIVSVYPRPLPTTNLSFLSAVMFDGRETSAPLTNAGTFLANLRTDLAHQAMDATLGHAQAAADGAVLWTYTPKGYDTWVGSYRITTATPVADPDRAFVYAASPDGQIHKLAVADGRAAWSTAITDFPRREKLASPLNYFRGRVIATTGGYIGDASPYQGHVAILDAANGKLLHVWNSLCSDRPGMLDPASCSESGSAIWGRAGAVIDSTTGNIFVATGNGLWDGRAHWGDAVLELDADATRLLGNYTPTNTAALDARDAH